MAFCKFCGKQIPEGGSCDCAASQSSTAAASQSTADVKETLENEVKSVQEKVANTAAPADNANDSAEEAKSGAAKVTEKVSSGLKQLNNSDIAKKVDGLAGELSENLPGGMKNNKTAVYVAAGIVLVLVIWLFCIIFGGGAKSTAKKFVNCSSDKKGGKTYYSLIYPDAVIDELKDEDKYDDLIDSFNEDVEDMIDDLEDDETMPKFDKILRTTKLKKSELKKAAEYFEELCEWYDADEDDIKVSKGYEVKVKIKYRDEDGDKKHRTTKICVVKVKGDGWKVIPYSADNL